jgi:hypothetical protein
MSRARPVLTTLLALGGAMVCGLPIRAWAAAGDLYYERTVMVTAGRRCGLFTPDLLAALASAQAQARGAALRAGVAGPDLDGAARRAQAKATAVACNAPDLMVAAGRVKSAFQGYAHLTSMTYPGDTAPWRADRTPGAPNRAAWRLAQDARFGWDKMTFGLVERGGVWGLMAVAAFADGAQPYAARLVARDPAVTSGPFLDPRGADAGGRIPLPARLPPRGSSQTFNAEARSLSGRDLAPPGAAQAWAFRFPVAATRAMAGLDPREAVAVEFVFAGRGGDQVRTAYVEVGDFAAGQAFLSVSQR